ncbi:hypothetical protein BDQ17DRAFT_1330798 [Cyathus striatus]|nr:hypothetical protein BDQ17DRAFT_1330798 [Cyathus striatus]
MSTAHSESARKIVLVKGLFDVFLSLSLIFAPALLYDGPIPLIISRKTGLPTPNWAANPDAAYGLAALCMGAAFAGIKAGRSYSNEAYQTVATLNGVFALTGLIGCYALPRKFGSSFLLLASLQDVFWFSAILLVGNFGLMDTLIGQSVPILENAKAQAMQGLQWSQERAGRAKEKGADAVQWGQEKAQQGAQWSQEKAGQSAQWGQEKASQGMQRGQEAAQWGQEKTNQGIQRGQEAAKYGQEKANQAAQWGSEKARQGFETEQEAVNWGKEKADIGKEKAYNEKEYLKETDKEFPEETQPVSGVSYAAAARQ